MSWIKLYRKFTEWEWYSDVNCKVVFLHLLLTANWEPKKWQGRVIDVGELVTGRASLAEEVGLSIQQVRTALKKLEESEVIKIETTNRFSVIKILNYEKYQENSKNQPTSNQPQNTVAEDVECSDDSEVNQQITNKQPTDNQRITTPKEYKNNRIKEYNNIDGGDYIYNINNIYSHSAPPPNKETEKVFSDYRANIGVPSPVEAEILNERITAQGAALVSLAVVEAVKNGAKSIRYIEKVLDAWERDGIKTVEDAKHRISERRHKQDNSGKLPSNVEKSTFRNYPEEPDKISDIEKQIIDKMMKEMMA